MEAQEQVISQAAVRADVTTPEPQPQTEEEKVSIFTSSLLTLIFKALLLLLYHEGGSS